MSTNKNITQDRIVGLVLIILSISGLLYTIFSSSWGSNVGMGAKALPQIYFTLLFLTGISIFLKKRSDEQQNEEINSVIIQSVIIFTFLGVFYFIAILVIGLVIATILYSIIIYCLLTVKPLKNWKIILISVSLGTLIIWGLFSKIIRITLPQPLIF